MCMFCKTGGVKNHQTIEAGLMKKELLEQIKLAQIIKYLV